MKKILSIFIIALLLFSGFISQASLIRNLSDDFDPLVDIFLTVDIISIRALDEIETSSDPDFFVNVKINDEEFTSPIWYDDSYLYDPWSVSTDIPDDV
ncbi:unnamed protein product, partial [marine sediment metagenome]